MSFINQRITVYAYINNDFRFLMGILPPALGFGTKLESSESEVEIFSSNCDTLNFDVFLGSSLLLSA